MYNYYPAETDRPTIKLLIHHVRDKIARKWRDLGIELVNDKQHVQLDVIEENHHHDVKTCCTKMFEYWLSVDTKASWNKLIEALERISENALAERIKIDILKGLILCTCIYTVW